MLDPRLNHVVAVAKVGSFTAAAQDVGVTQSAVTKSVADLERRLGYLLFYRTSRGATVTQKGREFVDRASKLLEDARDLLRGPPVGRDPFAGVLRIVVCPAWLELSLEEPLAYLLSRHRNVRFNVSSSSLERVVHQLREHSVDVALGFEEAFRDTPDLELFPMGSLQPTLFVRKNHPALANPPVTLSELANYDFVSPSDSVGYGSIIRRIYEDQGIDSQGKLHIADLFSIVRRIVATTDAIGMVNLPQAGSAAFREEFEILECQESFQPAPLCGVIGARWEPSAATRAFINAGREFLSCE